MSNKTTRIQFEISQLLANEIEAFESEAEITSHREFYANLVALWRWSASRVKEGKIICALDVSNLRYNELTLPALETIKYKALVEKELALATQTVESSEKPTVNSTNSNLTIQPA